MKKTLLLLLAAACVAPAYSQISYIFRKDTTAVRIESGDIFKHKVDTAAQKTSVLAGGVETPVDLIDSIGVYAVDVPLLTIELPDNPEITELKEKDTYLKARITLSGNGMTDDFGPADCKIKGRGNSTWNMRKKPYRIKFDKKAQVGNVKKGKNLVLLANYIDPTLMKNSLAFEIAKRLGVPYVNSYTPCLLRFNGVDKGSYLMTEKVGINSSSVDIDETKSMFTFYSC